MYVTGGITTQNGAQTNRDQVIHIVIGDTMEDPIFYRAFLIVFEMEMKRIEQQIQKKIMEMQKIIYG